MTGSGWVLLELVPDPMGSTRNNLIVLGLIITIIALALEVFRSDGANVDKVSLRLRSAIAETYESNTQWLSMLCKR